MSSEANAGRSKDLLSKIKYTQKSDENPFDFITKVFEICEFSNQKVTVMVYFYFFLLGSVGKYIVTNKKFPHANQEYTSYMFGSTPIINSEIVEVNKDFVIANLPDIRSHGKKLTELVAQLHGDRIAIRRKSFLADIAIHLFGEKVFLIAVQQELDGIANKKPFPEIVLITLYKLLVDALSKEKIQPASFITNAKTLSERFLELGVPAEVVEQINLSIVDFFDLNASF